MSLPVRSPSHDRGAASPSAPPSQNLGQGSSLASLAGAARSAFNVVAAAASSGSRGCSPVGRQTSFPIQGDPRGRQMSKPVSSSFSTSDVTVSTTCGLSPRGTITSGSPRNGRPPIRQTSSGASIQVAAFLPNSSALGSPRYADANTIQFRQSTSFPGALHGPETSGVGLRGCSPVGRQSSVTAGSTGMSRTSAGVHGCWTGPGSGAATPNTRSCLPGKGLEVIPSRPSESKIIGEVAGMPLSPFYRMPSLSSAAPDAMVSGNPKPMVQPTRIPSVSGIAPSPFWQPGTKMPVTEPVIATTISGSASRSGDVMPPPGLLGELLSTVAMPKPKKEASPSTVFWKPPPEAAVVCEPPPQEQPQVVPRIL
jgi:hypothetical protein